MLTKYVRNSHRRPNGILIAVDSGKIGYSLCSKKDSWDKKRGLAIAYGRAVDGFHHSIPDSLYLDFYEMINRADHYYGRGTNVLQ